MLKKTIIMILFLMSISALFAQETQVSFDKEGKIMEIDANIENDLQLFPDIQNFESALLFKISDDKYVVEISYKSGDKILRTKQNMDKTQFEELQTKIELLLEKKKPKSVLNQEGRGFFLLSTTLIATSIYGPLLPVAFKIYEPEIIAGAVLVTGGAGFFVPWLLSENREITRPQAILTSGFLYSGVLHGASLAGFFIYNILGEEYFSSILFDPFEEIGSLSALIALGTSIGEGFLGYYAADALHLTEGEASMYAFLDVLGFMDGLLTSLMFETFENFDPNNYFLASLAGSGAGLLSGSLLNATGDYKSIGNTTVFATASLLGLAITPAILPFLEYPETSTICAGLLGGQVGGSVIGHFLVKGKSFSEGEGTIIALSTVGGYLVGVGLYTMGGQYDNYMLLAGWAGACAGFLTTYLIADQSTSVNSVSNRNDNKLNIAFHPESIVLKTINPVYKEAALPLLNVTYSY